MKICELINGKENKPRVLINATALGKYRDLIISDTKKKCC